GRIERFEGERPCQWRLAALDLDLGEVARDDPYPGVALFASDLQAFFEQRDRELEITRAMVRVTEVVERPDYLCHICALARESQRLFRQSNSLRDVATPDSHATEE